MTMRNFKTFQKYSDIRREIANADTGDVWNINFTRRYDRDMLEKEDGIIVAVVAKNLKNLLRAISATRARTVTT